MFALLPTLLLALLPSQPVDRYADARATMVRDYLIGQGIDDPRVLAAMRATPRHEFLRPSLRPLAYRDQALDIGYKQTISPPYIVAYMTQTLDVQPSHKVLEIGTGSGYQAAVLSPLAREVYSIEIVPQLGRTAAKVLERLELDNVTTKVGDGYVGWEEHAPFDRIIVTCSPEDIPKPLVDQLADGGIMLIPVGQRYQQVFHLLEKRDGKLAETKLVPTLFVPMTGRSEELRDVQPDGRRPELRNGSFETLLAGDDADTPARPTGWHYQRGLSLIDDASEGRRAIRLEKTDAGDLAQCLQGMAIDGRHVRELDGSLAIRGEVPGTRGTAPSLSITFFDARRLPIGRGGIGPIRGVPSEWKTINRRIAVPRQAREAIVSLSMNDATGRLDIDAVKLTPVE